MSLSEKSKFSENSLRTLFLSIFLEVLQFIVPFRAFEIYDVSANFAGVLVAYYLLKIYKFWKNYE